jgi:hypothetical protein
MVSTRSNRSGTVANAGDGKADKVVPQVSKTASNRTGRATEPPTSKVSARIVARPGDGEMNNAPVRLTGVWAAFWDDVAGVGAHSP